MRGQFGKEILARRRRAGEGLLRGKHPAGRSSISVTFRPSRDTNCYRFTSRAGGELARGQGRVAIRLLLLIYRGHAPRGVWHAIGRLSP